MAGQACNQGLKPDSGVQKGKDAIDISIWLVLVSIFIGKMCAGAGSILFPITLNAAKMTNGVIGIILSAEVVSVIFFTPLVGVVIGKMGVIGSVVAGSLGRIVSLSVFSLSNNPVICFITLLVYGSSSSLIGIAYQTWINCANLKSRRGLIMGIYIGSMSLGIAVGPLTLRFIDITANITASFAIASGLSLLSLVPVIFLLKVKPPYKGGSRLRILFIVKNGKKVIASAFVGGIIFWGLPAFLTLYGMGAGMKLKEAALLLTMFMGGGMAAGPFLSYLSDKFEDRHNIIILSFFFSLLCSFFLPIAITNTTAAYCLLFFWGAAMQGVYSGSMTLLADIFRKEDQVSASVAFTQFKAIGGYIGITLIGFAMDWASSEGLVYVVAIASMLYFTFALSQYRVD